MSISPHIKIPKKTFQKTLKLFQPRPIYIVSEQNNDNTHSTYQRRSTSQESVLNHNKPKQTKKIINKNKI